MQVIRVKEARTVSSVDFGAGRGLLSVLSELTLPNAELTLEGDFLVITRANYETLWIPLTQVKAITPWPAQQTTSSGKQRQKQGKAKSKPEPTEMPPKLF